MADTDYQDGDGYEQINPDHPSGAVHRVKELDDFQRQTRRFLRDEQAGLAAVMTVPYAGGRTGIRPMRGTLAQRPSPQGRGAFYYAKDIKTLFIDINDGEEDVWMHMATSYQDEDAGAILRAAGAGQNPTFSSITFPALSVAFLQHIRNDNVSAGGVVSGWNTRPITDMVSDGGFLSDEFLENNRFVFTEPGHYRLYCVATGRLLRQNRLRLHNVTDDRRVEVGTNANLRNQRGTISIMAQFEVVPAVDNSISVNGVGDQFEIQHYAESSGSNAMGIASDGDDRQVYLNMEIYKLS